jgi:hypothetical protein
LLWLGSCRSALGGSSATRRKPRQAVADCRWPDLLCAAGASRLASDISDNAGLYEDLVTCPDMGKTCFDFARRPSRAFIMIRARWAAALRPRDLVAKFTRRSIKSDGRSACNSQEDRVCWISPRKATTDPRAIPTCRATLDMGSSSPPPLSLVSASNQSDSGVPKGLPRFSQRLYASERICSSEGFGWSMEPFYRVNGAQYCAFRSRVFGTPPTPWQDTGQRWAAKEARASHANFFGRRELMAGEHRQQRYGGRRKMAIRQKNGVVCPSKQPDCVGDMIGAPPERRCFG